MVALELDPTAIVTGAIDTLSTTLSGVAGPALVVGGSVLALTFGWRLVKKFIK
jgi:hypothetical protein